MVDAIKEANDEFATFGGERSEGLHTSAVVLREKRSFDGERTAAPTVSGDAFESVAGLLSVWEFELLWLVFVFAMVLYTVCLRPSAL